MSGILWGGALFAQEPGEVRITGGTASHFVFTFQGIDAVAGWYFDNSGALTRNSNGSLSPMGVAREWKLTQSTVGNTSCSLSISIRASTTQTVLDTATYNIDVSKEN